MVFKNKFFLLSSCGCVLCALLSLTAPVRAGFEWTPPATAEEPMPRVAPEPVQPATPVVTDHVAPAPKRTVEVIDNTVPAPAQPEKASVPKMDVKKHKDSSLEAEEPVIEVVDKIKEPGAEDPIPPAPAPEPNISGSSTRSVITPDPEAELSKESVSLPVADDVAPAPPPIEVIDWNAPAEQRESNDGPIDLKIESFPEKSSSSSLTPGKAVILSGNEEPLETQSFRADEKKTAPIIIENHENKEVKKQLAVRESEISTRLSSESPLISSEKDGGEIVKKPLAEPLTEKKTKFSNAEDKPNVALDSRLSSSKHIDMPVTDKNQVVLSDEVPSYAPEKMEKAASDSDFPVKRAEKTAENDSVTPKRSAPVDIKLYPKEDSPQDMSKQSQAVLPSDIRKDIGELSEKDVIVKDIEKAHVEDIFWIPPEQFNVIEGFGDDMPLALALRQIVPPRYAFVFGDKINPGMLVSWRGGKAWNLVLEDALKPLGMQFEMQRGTLISISSVRDQATPSAVKKSTPALKSAAVKNVGEPSEFVEEEHDSVSYGTLATASDLDDLGKPDEQNNKSHEQKNVEPVVFDNTARARKPKPSSIDTSASSPLDEIYKGPETHAPAPRAPAAQLNEGLSEESKMPQSHLLQPSPGEKKKEAESSVNSLNEYIVHPQSQSVLSVHNINAAQIAAAVEPSSGPERDPFLDSAAIIEALPSDSVKLSDAPTDSAHNTESLLTSAAFTPEEKETIFWNATNVIPPLMRKSSHDDLDLSAPISLELATLSLHEQAPRENDLEHAGHVTEKAVQIEIIEPEMAFVKPAVLSTFRKIPSDKILIWEARRGDNLKKIISEWAKIENIELVWTDDKEYKVDKDVFISGTFQNAVDVLVTKSVRNPPAYMLELKDSYSLRIGEGESL